MKLRAILIKVRLKLRAWAVRFRPKVRPLPLSEFYEKYWSGNMPEGDFLLKSDRPRFFFEPLRRKEYVAALTEHFPRNCEKILKSAADILDHRFNLLGSGERWLGDSINWHRDFKSDFEWPPEHYSRVRTVDLNNDADVKVPWELSRLQSLTILGRAYWLTEETKYKTECESIIVDWETGNPIDCGVNWTCSMEVAIRTINIFWNIFYLAEFLDEHFICRVVRMLYYHALHIERNLETIAPGSNSNHLIADYLGLFYVGLLLPECDRSEIWLRLGKEGLESEMKLQVREDGADYECSTSYHRLVLEMFLSAFILASKNDLQFSDSYTERLKLMLTFSVSMSSQSGNVTAIGDNDDGFIVKLDNANPHNHAPLLDIGGRLFGLALPEEVGLCEERLWYVGPESLTGIKSCMKRAPIIFKKSGYAVIQNNTMHLVYNAADIPLKSFGGHKHNDLLSLTLEINGVPFLIDAGTACYTSDHKLRNRSRTTSAHNTVTIDGEEQQRFMERVLFYMPREALAHIDLWTVTDDLVTLSGYHDGYKRLNGGIRHRRTIETSLQELSIKIIDEFTGKSKREHQFESNYLTSQQCRRLDGSNEVLITAPNAANMVMQTSCSEPVMTYLLPTEYFPFYGQSAPATQIRFSCRALLPFRMSTTMTYRSRSRQQLAQLGRSVQEDLISIGAS